MIYKFSSPPKSEIVVFDGASLSDLEFVLEEKSYLVIENRKERIKVIYLGIFFLINCLKNFFLNLFKNNNLHTIYLFTLIKMINPRLVVTSVDNSFKFSDLAKLLDKEIKFIAIQNANRYDFEFNEYNFKKKFINKNLNKKYYYIPNYLCFGQYEIEQIKKYNLSINKVSKIGSIRTANFYEYIERNNVKLNRNKYDLCLISEPAMNVNEHYNFENFEQTVAQIASNTIKYSIKHNLKFVFLQKRRLNSEEFYNEFKFYEKYLEKNELDFLKKNLNFENEKFTSYFGLFQSHVAIGSQSTLLSDKIGCKEKILAVSPTEDHPYKFKLGGICKLIGNDYNEFENRLTEILKINTSQYLSKLYKPTEHIMEFDKNLSAIKKVRKLLF
ncbi:hypothetical protein OAS95_02590 [Pelagibacteraceae bacterium]|jgi:surface carbohydrate biosynthesis protein|nr:hypothetical protein [Pelagibacteraceae bacterium]